MTLDPQTSQKTSGGPAHLAMDMYGPRNVVEAYCSLLGERSLANGGRVQGGEILEDTDKIAEQGSRVSMNDTPTVGTITLEFPSYGRGQDFLELLPQVRRQVANRLRPMDAREELTVTRAHLHVPGVRA